MQEPVIAGTLEAQTLEPRSSVEIAQNSKGEPAVKVKAYGADGESLESISDRVVAVYRSTVEAVGA